MSIDFDWIKPEKTRGNLNKSLILAKKYKSSKSPNGFQLTVVIPVEAMKLARFIIGDRVQMAFAQTDRGMCVALKRVPESGFKLSVANVGSDPVSKNSTVKVARAIVKAKFTDDMPENVSFGNFEMTDEGVLLGWEEK